MNTTIRTRTVANHFQAADQKVLPTLRGWAALDSGETVWVDNPNHGWIRCDSEDTITRDDLIKKHKDRSDLHAGTKYANLQACPDNSRTYTIPAYHIDDFKARIVKLQKKAAKLQVEAPTCTWGDSFPRQIGTNRMNRPQYGEYVDVNVCLPMVHLPGHKFLGTVEHLEGGNILRTIEPGHDLLPFRDGPATCDHCHKIRRRIDTYLILHVDTGKIVRVGSGCLTDYLGVDRLAILQFNRSIEACGEEYEGGGFGHGTPREGVEFILQLTAYIVRCIGWTSKAAAEARNMASTAGIVSSYLYSTGEARKHLFYAYPALHDADDLETRDVGTGTAALQWARSIDPNTGSDYLHNVRVACNGDTCEPKHFGIVCSAVSAYLREQDKLQERARLAPSANVYFGKVGDKIGRKLSAADKKKGINTHPAQVCTITHRQAVDTAFGTSTLIKFRTDDGVVFTWFASGDIDAQKGARVELIGTVKGHKEYKGNKETQITRGDFNKLEDAPQAACSLKD